MIEFPPYRLDRRNGRLWQGDRPVELRPKAWALLAHLAGRAGALVTKEELHRSVWGETVVSDDTLTQTLGELRRALGDDPRSPRIIQTVHRRGIRFVAPVRPAPAEARERPPVGPAGPPAPPPAAPPSLVGRQAELAALRAFLGRVAEGERHVVFVEGEPGIGKTSLVEAFLVELRSISDAVVGLGQCLDQHGEQEPYMPVLEALERLIAAQPGLAPVLRDVAPSWLAQIPALRGRGDSLVPAPAQTDLTPHRMLREFATFLEAGSIDRPLVLVLEDLQWSDRGTVDLVSTLAQRRERARVLVVGTYRLAETIAHDHPLGQVVGTLRARRRCREIALEYLSEQDVATYLRRALGPVTDDVTAVVHGHTDGNPLFMARLVDHLLERGWLVEERGVWRLTESRATIEQEVPADAEHLIEGQLRLLTGSERAVLEAASVAGLTFQAPVASAALDRPLAEIEETCADLAGRGRWLVHRPPVEWPDGTMAAGYAFGHALYQRVLYERISPSRRASLHQRIGERLETGYQARTAEVAGELALHFQRSRDRRRAVTFLEQAAWRAYERWAYRDAAASIEPALAQLALLPPSLERDRDELRLRRLQTILLSQTGGYVAETLHESLVSARSLSERLGHPAEVFDVLCALCLLYSHRGDLVQARQVGSELAQLAEQLGPSAQLESAFLRGAIFLWSGELEAAEPWLARALASPVRPEEADRPYGVNPGVAALSFESLRLWMRDERIRALAVREKAMALAQRLGRPFAVAHAATLGGFLLLLDEQWGPADRLFSQALEVSEEYGFVLWQGSALVGRGRVLVEGGEVERGLADIHRALDLLGRARVRLGCSLWRSLQAEACLRAGRLDEGLAAVQAGLAESEETGARAFEAELWRVRAGLLTARSGGAEGRREAVESMERARAVARAQGARALERRARPAPAATRPRRPSR